MGHDKIKQLLIIWALVIVGGLLFTSASAQNPVVVIPLFGDDPTPLQNIITVSPSGGDFTDPLEAIDSIPATGAATPTANNPYLIVIGPGDYELQAQLVMRPYVSLTGSGVDTTVLRGNVASTEADASAALIVTANQSSLSHLTVINESTATQAASFGIYSTLAPTLRHLKIDVDSVSLTTIGLVNSFAGGSIDQLTIEVNGAGGRTVIGMQNNSSPVHINHLRMISSSNASQATGMENRFSAVRMQDFRITALGLGANTDAIGMLFDDEGSAFINEHSDGKIYVAGGTNAVATGLFTDGASPVVRNVDVEVVSGNDSTGVYTIGTSTSNVSHCKVRVSGSEYATGVSVAGENAVSRIEHCTLEVSNATNLAGGVDGTDGHLVVSHTLFRGAGVSGPGDADCLYSASEFSIGGFATLDFGCSLPL